MGAAREVDLKLLAANWSYILLYGLLGTLINFIGLFCFIFVFKEMTGINDLSDNAMLLLSSTLTATDTVSVLTLLNKESFPKVHSIIFGEGLLNDAMAIILFNLSKKLIAAPEDSDLFSQSGLFLLLKEFGFSITLSIVVGLGAGYAFLYISRRAPFSKETQTTAVVCLIFTIGFASFYFAELHGLSGIVAIFSFVVIACNYSSKFLDKETFITIDALFRSGGFLAESVAFVYLGFQGVAVFASPHFAQVIVLSMLVLLAMGLIRWISIGMPAFLFLCYDDLKVQPSELVLIWYSGLIRGSVSVALVFSFQQESTHSLLKSVVLMVSLCTTLGLGAGANWMIRKLGFVETHQRYALWGLRGLCNLMLIRACPDILKGGYLKGGVYKSRVVDLLTEF